MAIGYDTVKTYDSSLYTFDGVLIVPPTDNTYKFATFTNDPAATFISDPSAAYTNIPAASVAE